MSNARFSILQARAVSDRRVSDAQFRTLAALGMYADKSGWCFPSLKTLAADLKKSPQAVGRDTIALRKLGYIEVKNRYDAKTKSRHSNLYRLKFDLPDFNMGDTPLSTPEVDALSTPEVEVNDPINAPKGLSFTELQEVNQKVDKILEMSRGDAWQGRDLVRQDLLVYADWYNKATGQVITKRVQKSWWKALSEWKDELLETAHLQEAFETQSKWRMVSDPNMLTRDACAIKAAGNLQTTNNREEGKSSGHFA